MSAYRRNGRTGQHGALPREARANIAAMALSQIYLGVDAVRAVRRATEIVVSRLEHAQQGNPLEELEIAMRGLNLLDANETARGLVEASGEALPRER